MRRLLISVLTLACFSGLAQTKKFSVKIGEPYELPRRSNDLAFFGNDEDGIVNLSLKKDELMIVRFNPKTLAQTSDKTVELTDATRNMNSETVVNFGRDYYWLHSDWNKSEKREKLLASKIDVIKGSLTNVEKPILESDKISGESLLMGGFYGSASKVDDKYIYNYSADHKFLLITYRLMPEFKNDKKNYDKLGMHVYDQTLTKVWGSEFTMPYTEQIMDNSDFSVDSKGNAYLLAKVYDSEKRKEKDSDGKPAYHFEVMKFEKGNPKMVTANLELGENFIRETSLIESASGEMIIACTYGKKSKGGGTDGIFLATVNAEGKVNKFKNGFYEFPLAELQKFESKRKQRKMERAKDYEAPNLKVRDVIVNSDGTVLLTCEEYKMVERCSTSPQTGATRCTYTFYYDDIIAARIGSNGQFDWLRKIPKKQQGGRAVGSMSFKTVADESGYYFLFLDNKKNMELEEDEAPKTHQDGFGGQVVVAKVDNAGVVSKEILFDTREEEVMVLPTKFSRINTNQFIGRAIMKKNNNYEVVLITTK